MDESKVCPRCGRSLLSGDFCPFDGAQLQRKRNRVSLTGALVADRYLVGPKIGSGGHADVYLAEHTKMGRKAALKIMRESVLDESEAVARFTREALNASHISHPNVAAIYDFGEDHGRLYLAMEYVDGEPLSALIEREGRLPPRRAAGIAWEIADALTAAHDLDIVHRDLKPENVMLTKHRDGSDWVKVVDFGIARIMKSDSQRVTSTGVVMGTQAYMSPEQLGGEPVDSRTDVYSAGMVLYAMLTGRAPFDATSTRARFAARLAGQRKSLTESCPGVPWPAELEQLLDRTLAVDPTKRLQTAPEFASELVRVTLDWLPDQLSAAEPWNQRLRFATPASVRLVSATVPGVHAEVEPARSAPASASASGVGVAGRTSVVEGASNSSRRWLAVAVGLLVVGVVAVAILELLR